MSARPKKPVPPAAFIVFDKDGDVRIEQEPLPRDQEELESRLASKFVGALEHFHGRRLQSLERGDPWPDFVATENEARWGIELAEVVDPDHARKYRIQRQYRDRILHVLGGIPPVLGGLTALVADNYQEPEFPRTHTSQGEQIVEEAVALIRSSPDELRSLQHGAVLFRRSERIDQLGILFTRFGPPSRQGRVRFSETFPTSSSRVELLLANTCAQKLDKRYQRSANMRLMLLTYGLRVMPILEGSREAQLATAVLSSRKHAFDEVWFLAPFPGQDLGHVACVWPVSG